MFEVWHGSVFMFLPLRYAGGEVLNLRLSRSKRLSYSELCDFLMKNIKDDIWAWFYCRPNFSLEEGLTIVETDNDVNKLYGLAEIHGPIEVYVCALPQALLVSHYHNNLPFDDSDDEVTSKVRVHEKRKEDVDKMSFEELIAWEQEEQNSPAIFRTPYVKPFVEGSLFRGRGELEYNDDFNDCPSFLRSVNSPYVPEDCDCGCGLTGNLFKDHDERRLEICIGSTPSKVSMLANDVDDVSTFGKSTVIQNVSKEIVLKASPLKHKNLFRDFEDAVDDDTQSVGDVSVVGWSNARPYVSTDKEVSESSPLKVKRVSNDLDEVPTVGASTVIRYVLKESRIHATTFKGKKLFDEFESDVNGGNYDV